MNRHRARETDIKLDIIFLVFYYNSRTWLLGVLSSHLRSGCGTPTRSSPKWVLHIPASGLRLTFFSCFLSHVPFNGFSIWLSDSQSNFVGRFASDTFLFFLILSWASLWLWPGFQEPTVHFPVRSSLIPTLLPYIHRKSQTQRGWNLEYSVSQSNWTERKTPRRPKC